MVNSVLLLLFNFYNLKLQVTDVIFLSIFLLQILLFPESFKKFPPPLPNLKHLEVKINDRIIRKLELRKSLLWCAPTLETLEIS